MRKQKNLTQVELGKLSGIHYTNIGRIENKGVIPQANVLYLIAMSLNTSVSWLITGKPDIPVPITTEELMTNSFLQKKEDTIHTQIYQILQQLTEGEKKELLTYMEHMLISRTT